MSYFDSVEDTGMEPDCTLYSVGLLVVVDGRVGILHWNAVAKV